MTLAAAVEAMNADLSVVPGLAEFHSPPPNKLASLPAMVVYPLTCRARVGSASTGSGRSRWGYATIRVAVHHAAEDIAKTVTAFTALMEAIPKAVLQGWRTDRFNDTVVQLGDPLGTGGEAPIRCEVGDDSWGGVSTFALRCDVDIAYEEEDPA